MAWREDYTAAEIAAAWDWCQAGARDYPFGRHMFEKYANDGAPGAGGGMSVAAGIMEDWRNATSPEATKIVWDSNKDIPKVHPQPWVHEFLVVEGGDGVWRTDSRHATHADAVASVIRSITFWNTQSAVASGIQHDQRLRYDDKVK